ncbi:MAG: class I SAM-dependent methyltransferase [Rhodospirillales bacterium]
MGFHDHYDRLYAAKDHAGEAACVIGLLGLRARARLLEVGCGTGMHSRAFTGGGLEVTAVDTDAAMIARARAAGIGADFHALPVEDLDSREFDGAAALFNVANYIVRRDALVSAFTGIARRLLPGAGFAFDCWNGVAVLADPPRNEVRLVESGGWRYEIEISAEMDAMRQCARIRNAVTATGPGGVREAFGHDLLHRLWTPAELRDALMEAGFAETRFLRWMQPGHPATAADWKVLVHARRPGGAS